MSQCFVKRQNPWLFCLVICGVLSACSRSSVHLLERFSACPEKPSCVCSEPEKATKPEWHQISPLRFVGDPEAAWEKLRSFVQAQPRAHLVLEEGRYMHVTFTSFFFRFVDDVEFKLEGDVIHIRSASRLGYSDFNVNRRRMEEIRQGLGW